MNRESLNYMSEIIFFYNMKDGCSMIAFVKWWFLFVLMVIGCFFAYSFEMHLKIWENDSTKLSCLILAIFSYMTIWCGSKTFFLGMGKKKITANLEEVGWFVSDLLLTIGMIGTVVGFIMMLGGFATIDIANSKSIQELIGNLGLGMSTALYTTLIGLICSALLKLQYFNLSQAYRKLRKSEKDGKDGSKKI
jgi:hypothetical protein